jgi:hypothetical protein
VSIATAPVRVAAQAGPAAAPGGRQAASLPLLSAVAPGRSEAQAPNCLSRASRQRRKAHGRPLRGRVANHFGCTCAAQLRVHPKCSPP